MPAWLTPLRETVSKWSEHKDARLGAALAYYSVFSLGPLILIAIAIAGLVFGAEAVQGQVLGTLKSFVGDTGTQAIEAMLKGADRPREGMVATAIGIGTLIFAAIGVVVQLKDALNTVWEVETTPGSGIWRFVRSYILSLAGVLALGFLLLTSMLLTAALAAAGKYVAPYLPEATLQVAGFAVSFAVISLLFAMMFKWLPDTKVEWRDVWLGAVLTAALFEVGKFLIGLYIGKQGLESTYGAAASIIVVLIWVYYSAQLVLMGAEFTLRLRPPLRLAQACDFRRSSVIGSEGRCYEGSASGVTGRARGAAAFATAPRNSSAARKDFAAQAARLWASWLTTDSAICVSVSSVAFSSRSVASRSSAASDRPSSSAHVRSVP
jgi:membrane protein